MEFRDEPSLARNRFCLLKIFEEDMLSAPDAMVVFLIIIPAINDIDTTEWYDVPPNSAKNPSGKLQIRIQTSISYSRSLVWCNTFVTFSNQIQIGLAWDMIDGHTEVDLDVSCVALSQQGQVVMADKVYYANTANSNESVIHSGDEKEGDEEGDDKRIVMQLDKIPQYIRCMYILLTVATPQMRIPDIKSTVLCVYNVTKKYLPLCSFTPVLHALSSQCDGHGDGLDCAEFPKSMDLVADLHVGRLLLSEAMLVRCENSRDNLKWTA